MSRPVCWPTVRRELRITNEKGLHARAAARFVKIAERFDATVEGFFWCAGQGGYGIQTCAALARVGAALVRGEPIPQDVLARGLAVDDLSPARR
nr:HPr family phosphocarrier protein [uncultured Rhodococcus sp.]